MKTYIKTLPLWILLLLLSVGLPALQAQQKKMSKKQLIQQLVEQQQYVFTAELARPMAMRQIFLTPPNSVTITRDTIQSDLPYFGRAFSAPMNPLDGGIRFTSTDFDYQKVNKKRGWNITIRPKDAKDVQQFYLQVFDNGKAELQVTSNNRQAISFSGYISERRD